MTFRLTDEGLPATNTDVAPRTERPPASSPRLSAPEVAAWVERARHGDAEAFRQLFHAHVVQVHRVVRRMVGARPEVDDLVQTTFVEAFRSLSSFRGDALFSTWLTRIAVRVSWRSRQRARAAVIDLPSVEAPEPAANTPGPERVTAARQTLLLVEALLDELRPKRRAAFVLHVLEGHSMDEVAAILSTSISAVKVRVHDARRHIERRLKQRPELAAALEGTGGAR